jgi:hypothetical protein
LKEFCETWILENNENLLQLFEYEGEQFSKFATDDFGGNCSAFELEIAYEVTWREKYTPHGSERKGKHKDDHDGDGTDPHDESTAPGNYGIGCLACRLPG